MNKRSLLIMFVFLIIGTFIIYIIVNTFHKDDSFITAMKNISSKISSDNILSDEFVISYYEDYNLISIRKMGRPEKQYLYAIRIKEKIQNFNDFKKKFFEEMDPRFNSAPDTLFAERVLENGAEDHIIICKYGTLPYCNIWEYIANYSNFSIEIWTPNTNYTYSEDEFYDLVENVDKILNQITVL